MHAVAPRGRLLSFLALLVTVTSGCPGAAPPVDGGGTDAPPADVPIILCETDLDCDDGLFCSGEEHCVSGLCERTRVDCDDGVACTTDRCSEERLTCVHTAPDLDGDGYFDASCVDGSGDPLGNDCDDDDGARYPGATEVCDASHDEDCDDTTLGGVDDDGDGFVSDDCCNGARCGDDCDDARDSSYPGGTEVCDGLDQNCDGTADDGVALDGFVDADGDGWGDSARPMAACADAPGWAPADHGGDCADDLTAEPNARAINPGQPEICDDVRNDCRALPNNEGAGNVNWYSDLDGDGFGDPRSGVTVSCMPVAGASLLGTDCDDASPARNPAAAEACNGIDDNCNGLLDFRIGANDFEDDDRDGLVDLACAPLGTDCNDRDPDSGPGELERCDGRDNDCDTIVDEGATSVVYYRDADGDGFGSPASGTIVACMTMAGYVPLAGDCNDLDPVRYPGATDGCNGADDDCDAAVDEMPASSMCSAPNADDVACISGRCESTHCVTNFGDCNGRGSDGCETDLRIDEAHCGACGTVCGPGETCTNSVCVSGCAAGQVFCAGACVDPFRDESWCGATSPCTAATDGAVCSIDAVCAAGTCSSSFILPGGDVAALTMARDVSYRIDVPASATIFYTLDGTTPGSSATTMSGPAPLTVNLTTGRTVRWYASYAGGATGPLQSFTHTTDTTAARNNLGVIGEGLNLNGSGPVISVTAGTVISATLATAQFWKSNNAGYCPGCVVYAQIVFNGAVASCLGNNAPYPGTTVSGRVFSITAPSTPGRYPVYLNQALDFSCQAISGGQIIGWVFVR